MDPRTGEIHNAPSEELVKKLELVTVKRALTAREQMEMQIRLYSPCACGSGKKFKFCCKVKS